jgi:4-amino-4-deoxy-L-arabinose transferase-like glycosyltransferase
LRLHRWAPVALAFLFGLFVRLPAFRAVHDEGDEVIYSALVEQLEAGRGYTLHGHPILSRGFVERSQYDTPLFYHPPGGVAFLWGFKKLFGPTGLLVAQPFCFALFFWSVIALASALLPRMAPLVLWLLAGSAALSPVVAHINTKLWIDNPRLSLLTLSAALFAWSARRASWRLNLLSAAALGAAVFIKLDTAIGVLLIPALSWPALEALPGARQRLTWIAPLALAAGAAITCWLSWRWAAYGGLALGAPGKPSAALVATNAYIRAVTVERSPWFYFTATPLAFPTLFSSAALLALLAAARKPLRDAWLQLGLLLLLLSFYAFLGAQGYSKLLRYSAFTTLPILLLAATLLQGALFAKDAPARRWEPARRLRVPLLALVALCCAAEWATGFRAAVMDTQLALIHLGW